VDRIAGFRLGGLLGIGVFLSGLELMITAVALPSIVVDLADWTQLRAASWIVNGYLLVSIVVMPLAGRLCDLWGARRLYLLSMALFTVGSALAGRAQGLEELIAARLVQASGGGAMLPVATAAAAHLAGAARRPQALGLVGALTFLGMAAGPFAGAAILDVVHPAAALAILALEQGPLASWFDAAWRYVFYLNVPFGLGALAIAWASTDWETPIRPGRLDLVGAALVSVALAGLLGGLTLAGSEAPLPGGLDPVAASWLLVMLGPAVGAVAAARSWAGRRASPPAQRGLPASTAFGAAVLVSLLTGYAFATAIVGGAVFVDRVLYGGPDLQRLALGALAAATAIGSLGAGLVARIAGLRVVTLAGLALASVALAIAARWTPATSIGAVAGGLAVFGLGFGLTVTPRSTAAVEALGREAFGVASAGVTVARMLGMAVGLAVLTAYGSTTIDRLWSAIHATPEAYRQVIPEELRDRPIRDGLVVQALERWASGEAARVMVGVFLVAAVVNAAAVAPAAALGATGRMLNEPPRGDLPRAATPPGEEPG
jgi:MFS family permease